MSRAQDYFERASAYTVAAEIAPEAGSRARLLQLAQHWAHLAQVAERNEMRSRVVALNQMSDIKRYEN